MLISLKYIKADVNNENQLQTLSQDTEDVKSDLRSKLTEENKLKSNQLGEGQKL